MYDDRTYLDNNAVLHLLGREYHITGLEGAGTSSIVYNATVSVSDNSIKTEKKVLIKELYPLNLSIGRNKTTGALIIPERSQNNFKKYIESFEKAAELQIELHNPLEKESDTLSATNSTSSIEDVCEHGNTLYSVMSVDNGQTYEEYKNNDLRSHIEICKNLAEAIQKYHKRGYLHLDIKPENIFVLARSNQIKLFDFDTVQLKEDINKKKCRVSYTPAFAPPELELINVNNTYYSVLDERTDIYTIGATLFYKLFNKKTPSFTDKLPNQTWNYEKSNITATATPQVKDSLNDYFRKTLAFLQNDRYNNVSEVINALGCILNLLNFKYNLVNQNIYKTSGDYFILRTQEIKQIRTILNEKHIAYLYGMGGIGKSETARAYAEEYRNDYSVIQLVDYFSNLEDTLGSLKFSDDDQYKKQRETQGNAVSRFEYVYKRLQQRLLNNEKTLIIIENYDLDITDTEKNKHIIEKNNEVERKLKELSVHFLFTTRNIPSSFKSDKTVKIDCFTHKQLREHFFKINPINHDDPERIDIINRIIDLTDSHTLSISLIARLSLAKEEWGECTLDDIFNQISRHGTNNNYDDLVESNIDDQSREDSVYNTIKSLFDFSSLKQDEQYVLLCAALLPKTGMNVKDFCELFSRQKGVSQPIDKSMMNSIKKLIKIGWLSKNGYESITISIHPIIADVALNELAFLFDGDNSRYFFRKLEYKLNSPWRYRYQIFPLYEPEFYSSSSKIGIYERIVIKMINRIPLNYSFFFICTCANTILRYRRFEEYDYFSVKASDYLYERKNDISLLDFAILDKGLCIRYCLYPYPQNPYIPEDKREAYLKHNISEAEKRASIYYKRMGDMLSDLDKGRFEIEMAFAFSSANKYTPAINHYIASLQYFKAANNKTEFVNALLYLTMNLRWRSFLEAENVEKQRIDLRISEEILKTAHKQLEKTLNKESYELNLLKSLLADVRSRSARSLGIELTDNQWWKRFNPKAECAWTKLSDQDETELKRFISDYCSIESFDN